MEKQLSRLKELDKEIRLLEHTAALLGWDQETYMPPAAITERADQLALLTAYVHRLFDSGEMGELFSSLGISGPGDEAALSCSDTDKAFARALFREYRNNTSLPETLVVNLAKQASLAQAQWVRAREDDDFNAFSPELDTMLTLIREKADCLGYDQTPYDALLDEFEPWMKTDRLNEIFGPLKHRLTEILARIRTRPQVDDSFLQIAYPKEKQEQFSRLVLEKMGFDLKRGRLDVSAHPFTTTLGRDDVRLTTRYAEEFFNTAIFGTIHEAGHGLYELGFDVDQRGTVLGTAASLGIHESQSRTWENMIGRSLPFWTHFFPHLSELFPQQLKGVSLEQFYRAVNRVELSLIRVEADEVTYNLHIILRFELEQKLINRDIGVADLPEAWNTLCDQLLGIKPESDAQGCLQDIHWSMGAIGYFPTYALGNLYGAQFYQSMQSAIPSLETAIKEGNLTPPLEWMRSNIHNPGSRYPAEDLCRKVTGEPLNPEYFLNYLEEKFSQIYGY